MNDDFLSRSAVGGVLGDANPDGFGAYWKKARDIAVAQQTARARVVEPMDELEAKSPEFTAFANVKATKDAFGPQEGNTVGAEESIASGPLRGKADALSYHPETQTLVSADFKFGGKSSNTNYMTQVMTIAAMGLDKYPEAKNISLVISRPDSSPTGGLHTQNMTREELDEWKTEVLEPAIRATQVANPRYNPGDVCSMCPGRGKCRYAKVGQ